MGIEMLSLSAPTLVEAPAGVPAGMPEAAGGESFGAVVGRLLDDGTSVESGGRAAGDTERQPLDAAAPPVLPPPAADGNAVLLGLAFPLLAAQVQPVAVASIEPPAIRETSDATGIDEAAHAATAPPAAAAVNESRADGAATSRMASLGGAAAPPVEILPRDEGTAESGSAATVDGGDVHSAAAAATPRHADAWRGEVEPPLAQAGHPHASVAIPAVLGEAREGSMGAQMPAAVDSAAAPDSSGSLAPADPGAITGVATDAPTTSREPSTLTVTVDPAGQAKRPTSTPDSRKATIPTQSARLAAFLSDGEAGTIRLSAAAETPASATGSAPAGVVLVDHPGDADRPTSTTDSLPARTSAQAARLAAFLSDGEAGTIRLSAAAEAPASATGSAPAGGVLVDHPGEADRPTSTTDSLPARTSAQAARLAAFLSDGEAGKMRLSAAPAAPVHAGFETAAQPAAAIRLAAPGLAEPPAMPAARDEAAQFLDFDTSAAALAADAFQLRSTGESSSGASRDASRGARDLATYELRSSPGHTALADLLDGRTAFLLDSQFRQVSAASSSAHMASALPGSLPEGTHAGLGEVPSQIVRAMHLQWRDGVGEAKLRLNPESLGEVTITLKVVQGSVTASIKADNPVTMEWIRSHQHELRTALDDQGLRLDQFDVTVNPDDRRQQEDDRPEHAHPPRPRRLAPGADAPRFELHV